MKVKIRVNADKNPDEDNSYSGIIIVVVENRPFAGVFNFKMEMFDGGGGEIPILDIKQNGHPVFTPETLAGTKGFLQKICRQSVEQAIDLMAEQNTRQSVYDINVSCDTYDLAEIKKFLRDTSRDTVY